MLAVARKPGPFRIPKAVDIFTAKDCEQGYNLCR